MSQLQGVLCKICKHPEKQLIEVGLVEHRSIKGMAARFGVSIWSLHRHRKTHMPARVQAVALAGKSYSVENLEQLREVESERLLANVVNVRARLYQNADQAEKVGDLKAANLSYAQIIRTLELVGKLLNQFSAHARVVHNSLVISPDYLRLRSALIEALQPYPEARMTVARVLREMEEIPEVEPNGKASN